MLIRCKYTVAVTIALMTSAVAVGQPCPRVDRDIGQPGASGPVRALVLHDDGSGEALFVGGSFSSIGGISASKIGKFDGEHWSQLGYRFNSWVGTLASYNGDLYAGGNFIVAPGLVPALHIAKWNGSEWSSVGPPGTGFSRLLGGSSVSVNGMAVHNDGSGESLFVGGDFDYVAGIETGGIAKWDGESWSRVGTGMRWDYVVCLAEYDDGSGLELFVCGVSSAKYTFAKWDGADWTPLDAPDGITTSMAGPRRRVRSRNFHWRCLPLHQFWADTFGPYR